MILIGNRKERENPFCKKGLLPLFAFAPQKQIHTRSPKAFKKGDFEYRSGRKCAFAGCVSSSSGYVSSLSQLACGKQLKLVLSPNGAPFCLRKTAKLGQLACASSSSLSCRPSGLHFACAKPPNLDSVCHPERNGVESKFCGSRALPERAKPREQRSCDRRDLLRMTNSFPDRCYIHYAAPRK